MTGFLVFPVIPFSLPDFLRWENGKIKKKNWEIKTEGDKGIINLTNWGTAIRILRIDFFFSCLFLSSVWLEFVLKHGLTM